ncbi:hypothetical protein [Campylobacter ureolyticus]|uniref:Uncharacterized protein n=1 Tax=Campylobacter ureolyticus TaxID=827 RepID=A0AAE7EAG9_9BACT|nr:hypothetical protein [Campylobacter ureolyticus]MCR8685244.1 hypothetical protein [Campylobacter ureolyticus]QKF84577.1 hypothetical protein CURT_1100 [Campylobacter ureolyticus]QQY35260.1 hypothetical protein I6I59_07010 [Campylobacter ureolyticus]SUX22113.1 Uncharacterised protein [Campylobacter ureolyticus]GKH60796.1 hypothetical protein CE91St25_11320 [Campylobacter ureolyticus]
METKLLQELINELKLSNLIALTNLYLSTKDKEKSKEAIDLILKNKDKPLDFFLNELNMFLHF